MILRKRSNLFSLRDSFLGRDSIGLPAEGCVQVASYGLAQNDSSLSKERG